MVEEQYETIRGRVCEPITTVHFPCGCDIELLTGPDGWGYITRSLVKCPDYSSPTHQLRVDDYMVAEIGG